MHDLGFFWNFKIKIAVNATITQKQESKHLNTGLFKLLLSLKSLFFPNRCLHMNIEGSSKLISKMVQQNEATGHNKKKTKHFWPNNILNKITLQLNFVFDSVSYSRLVKHKWSHVVESQHNFGMHQTCIVLLLPHVL